MSLGGRVVRSLVVLFVVLGAACASHNRRQTEYDPAIGLQTFDAAWSIVHETHFDTTFNGVDWLGVRDELRPVAAEVDDKDELRRVIRRMLSRLGQSHFSLISGDMADGLDDLQDQSTDDRGGDAGMDVRLTGDVVVVSRVDSGGPAEAAGIEPGWTLMAINEELVETGQSSEPESPEVRSPGVRAWEWVTRSLSGQPGGVHRLELLDGLERRQLVEVVLRLNPGQPVRFGNLPTIYARFANRRVDEDEFGVSAGVIWYNTWMAALVKQVDHSVDEYRTLDGMILDLRGNTGGLAAMVMGVAGHFYDQRTTLGFMKTRHNELRYFANPRRSDQSGDPVEPYAGPVAILIDGMTASASELLAGGMQATGRARVFGTTSMGAVLPAAADRLPNGDVLYHAFGDFTTASGVRLEGRGVIPDELVHLTREDLLAGRDAPMSAALRWIADQRDVSGER